MRALSRKTVALGLVALLAAVACEDSSCGGCVTPLAEPFPAQPRVYHGVQARVTEGGFNFIEQNLPTILDNLLADGLVFQIPPTGTSVLGVDIDICQSGCTVTVEILDANVSLTSPDKVAIDGHINMDTNVDLDTFLGTCQFPVALRNKPLHAEVQLFIDPDSYFMHFGVGGIQVTIGDNDYQIECPAWFDWLLEAFKSYLTDLLNSQVQGQLDGAIQDLVAAQTCLPCNFYTAGCPAGSSCNGDGFCADGGGCLIKPLGMIGTVELGAMLASIDPLADATLDLLIAPGQAAQPPQDPFVRGTGLEIRAIGGTYSDRDPCVPDPPPVQIPDTGIADSMPFANQIPGQGDDYMMGVAIADMYLDHFIYQLWRSGFLCLNIDSYGLDLISSGTLAFILPSIGTLAGGENLPVQLRMRPQAVPFVEVGAGTFLADGTVDEPILYAFLPQLRLDIRMKLHGRWVNILSLTQDVSLDLALEFTPDNAILPVVGEDAISVTNVQVSNHELLAESEAQLAEVVPQLIGLALPQLLGSLEAIALPDLQGFVLDVKSLQGDLRRNNGPYHDFMSIYADLSFAAPPAPNPVLTRTRLARADGQGIALETEDPELEVQVRIDERTWSPFRRGGSIQISDRLRPGQHLLEVRARRIGDYRSLDQEPQRIAFEVVSTSALPTGRGELDLPPAAAASARLAPAPGQADERTTDPTVGCAAAGAPAGSGLWPWALLALALGRRLRRRD